MANAPKMGDVDALLTWATNLEKSTSKQSVSAAAGHKFQTHPENNNVFSKETIDTIKKTAIELMNRASEEISKIQDPSKIENVTNKMNEAIKKLSNAITALEGQVLKAIPLVLPKAAKPYPPLKFVIPSSKPAPAKTQHKKTEMESDQKSKSTTSVTTPLAPQAKEAEQNSDFSLKAHTKDWAKETDKNKTNSLFQSYQYAVRGGPIKTYTFEKTTFEVPHQAGVDLLRQPHAEVLTSKNKTEWFPGTDEKSKEKSLVQFYTNLTTDQGISKKCIDNMLMISSQTVDGNGQEYLFQEKSGEEIRFSFRVEDTKDLPKDKDYHTKDMVIKFENGVMHLESFKLYTVRDIKEDHTKKISFFTERITVQIPIANLDKSQMTESDFKSATFKSEFSESFNKQEDALEHMKAQVEKAKKEPVIVTKENAFAISKDPSKNEAIKQHLLHGHSA